jgi:hypothetical protein
MVGKIMMSPAVLKSMTQQVSFINQSTMCKFSYARKFFVAINTKLKKNIGNFYSRRLRAEILTCLQQAGTRETRGHKSALKNISSEFIAFGCLLKYKSELFARKIIEAQP